ncbi:MAG: hypothetical protein LBR07_04440 [Puniceicoccales bacterium]|jgi:hypothetical protein|nr:hypothetical protein [Puniceicoccales bacterium]
MKTPDSLAAIREEFARLAADIRASLASTRRPATTGYIAGDKAAAAFLGLRNRETFLSLMRAQRIEPIRTARAKLWRRVDLENLESDATPFLPNNPYGRNGKPSSRT